ncbi:hypothetical protein [Anaerosolibacter sp.]|uniref:hypothetical protein n=1 Tax=Anaerosolibacter sp. TaxID=1872527 RepID=UPI0039EEDB0C
MHKNVFLLIILVAIMPNIVGCEDDDFAPYTKYEKELDVSIGSYPTSIDDVTDEVTQIAQAYQDGVKLTNAKVVLEGSAQIDSGKGIILFDFYKEHETKNQITRVLLEYSMITNKVDKIKFEQGHGKRVGGYSNPINKELGKMPFSELINNLHQDVGFQEKAMIPNPRIEIDYTSEINIYLYDNDKNDGPIYRKKLESISSATK